MTKSSANQILDSSSSDVSSSPDNSLEENLPRFTLNGSSNRSESTMLGFISGQSQGGTPDKARLSFRGRMKSWRKSKDRASLNEITREEALLVLQRQSSSNKQPSFIHNAPSVGYDYIDISKSYRAMNSATTASTAATSNTAVPSKAEAILAASPQMLSITTAPSLDEVVKALGGPPHHRSDQLMEDRSQTFGKPLRFHASHNTHDNVKYASLVRSAEQFRCPERHNSKVGQTKPSFATTTTATPAEYDTGFRSVRPVTLDRISNGRRYQPERVPSSETAATTTAAAAEISESAGNMSDRNDTSSCSRRKDSTDNRKNSATISVSDKDVATAERPKKRKFLSIVIPKEVSTINGIRQLSTADTKTMDEALELASTFSRLSYNDHNSLLPRTPGTGSTSKESLSSSLDSPRSKWFSFRKKCPYEEKKSYIDELNSTLTSSPSELVTLEGQQAYNSLVAQRFPLNSPNKSAVNSSGASHVNKSQSLCKSSGRTRNSLSESDRTLTSVRDYKRFIRRDRLSLDPKCNSLSDSNSIQQLLNNCDSMPRTSCSIKIMNNKTLRSLGAMDIVTDNPSGEENSASTLTTETGLSNSSDNSSPINITPVNTCLSSLSEYNENLVADELNVSEEPNYCKVAQQEILSTKAVSINFRTDLPNQDNTQHSSVTVKSQKCESLPRNFEGNDCIRNDMELQIIESSDVEIDGPGSEDTESSPSALHESIEGYSRVSSLLDDTIDYQQNVRDAEITPPTLVEESVAPPPVAQKILAPPPLAQKILAPPPIPPRIPLRQSTINNPLPRRKNPLPSDPSILDRPRTASELALTGSKRPMRQTSCHTIGRARHTGPILKCKDRWLRLNSSASSSSSSSAASGSDQMNSSSEFTDDVFNGIEPFYSNRSQRGNNRRPGEQHTSPVGKLPRHGEKSEWRHVGGIAENIELSARELGIQDAGDHFWDKHVTFDIPDPEASDDMSRRTLSMVRGQEQGSFDTADDVTYEDIMECALEDENDGLLETIS